MLPHDKGTDGTDNGLGKVQHDLEQEVQRESPGNHFAVVDRFIGEGASDGVIWVQCAHAVFSLQLTVEVTGLRVVVSGKSHDQHRDDQANRTQDKVQELQTAERGQRGEDPRMKCEGVVFYKQCTLYIGEYAAALVSCVTIKSKCMLASAFCLSALGMFNYPQYYKAASYPETRSHALSTEQTLHL